MKRRIIRAREELNHRSDPSARQQPPVPESPVGDPRTEMAEAQLDHAVGGNSPPRPPTQPVNRLSIGMDLVK